MITADTILRAKAIIDNIEELQAELAGLFGASVSVAAPPAAAAPAKRRGRPPGPAKVQALAKAPAAPTGGKKRTMSAEGRARIAAAAKARWARFRSDQKRGGK